MAVKRGRHGGISEQNQDWRSYYGAEAYDTYVAERKSAYREIEEKQQKIQEEERAFQRTILGKKLYQRDENGKIIPHSFELELIDRMDDENRKKFLDTLTKEEIVMLDTEFQEAIAIIQDQYYEAEMYEDYGDCGDY